MITIVDIAPDLVSRTCAVTWSFYGNVYHATATMEDDDGVWYVHEWDGPAEEDAEEAIGNAYTSAYEADQVDREENRYF